MIGIYKIENLINGKVYIGQSVDIKGRWNEHKLVNSRASKDALKRQKYPLYLAFEKYGLDNFSFEVIEECSVEELNEKEQFYIKKYNSYIDFPNSNGYNLTLGGDGTQKVTKEQISNIVKLWDEGKTTGEIMDILHVEKHAIIKYLKLFSSTYSIEESDFRGRINAGISHRKKVDCYDLWGNYLKTYSSITEASEILDLNKQKIINCCKGKSPRVKNYRFTYEKENKEIEFNNIFKSEWTIKISNNKEYHIFASLIEAANFINSSVYTIKRCMNTEKLINGWRIEGKKY